MHWWRRDLLHNEGNNYHSLLTSMSLTCLVYRLHLRLKATTANWQPESVLQNKQVVVFISALEKSCVWVSFWVFRGHQKTENTLTIRQCKQIHLFLMTNISYWIVNKKCCCFSEAIQITHLFVLSDAVCHSAQLWGLCLFRHTFI